MRGRIHPCLVWTIAIGLWATPAVAITVGQTDDFQSGNPQGWGGGTATSFPANGGPNGAGDMFMQLNSGGGSLGTRNSTQWAGDYLAAGVTRVDVDLKNSGPDPVSLRFMIFTPGCDFGAGDCTAWSQTVPTVLLPYSGWVKVEFSLAEPDLTRVIGPLSYAASMAQVERVHLKHDPGPPDPPGTQIFVNAMLGVDNVVALPEPSSPIALSAGALAVLVLPRRGNRSQKRTGFPTRSKWIP
jgi:hypothetical protein